MWAFQNRPSRPAKHDLPHSGVPIRPHDQESGTSAQRLFHNLLAYRLATEMNFFIPRADVMRFQVAHQVLPARQSFCFLRFLRCPLDSLPDGAAWNQGGYFVAANLTIRLRLGAGALLGSCDAMRIIS